MKMKFLAAIFVLCLFFCSFAAGQGGADRVRFATFNTSLYRSESGGLIKDLQDESNEQAKKGAKILQLTRPDVLLLNEFDYDEDGQAAGLFFQNFLARSQGGSNPLVYEYAYFAPVNTGVDSGMDLDGDGKKSGTENDAYGYGKHPGQYGMLVLSRYPILQNELRTFQKFLWKDMPDHEWPVDPGTGEPYYSDEVKESFRLSSKSHWDVPVLVDGKIIHFLVSHPTPPVFDQEEDRNGCRNHDEIRMWADYVDAKKGGYLYDDQGMKGALPFGSRFVIAGDLNADPTDGDSRNSAATLLTRHPMINNDFVPKSQGGIETAKRDGGRNGEHKGDAACDTGDFNDESVGNLRIDYVLPSRNLEVIDSGVFWPASEEEGAELVDASDHRLVWIDIRK